MSQLPITSRTSSLILNLLLLLLLMAPISLSRLTTRMYPTIDRRETDDIQPSPGGTTHTITVGRAAHAFKPSSVKAAIGDVIKFEFYPTNHSVVRAEFDAPCIPREKMYPKETGFFSGFFPMDSVPENPPTWSWKVDTTDPVFFYCSAVDACTFWGMVGVINPTADKPLSTFAANSKTAQFQLSPGEPFPGETVNNKKTTSSSSSSSKKNSRDTLSTGAIVGISLGAVATVVLIGLVFYWFGKWRNEKSGPSTPKEVAERQSQGLLGYNQPGAHENMQYGCGGSAGAGVQQVTASYYDFSRGDARIGSYYSPPNMLHVGSVYLSPAQGYNPESVKSSPAELGGQSFSPVELAVGERGK
ncbi:hypothetical protein EV426DRAFT_287931 [Tirmania nivea]|nr:hypothetical protein EV426DRAFT_287931 [Tirmania nivea]